MRSLWRRAIALVLIPLVVTACHTWRVAEMEPKALVETKAPAVIRLTTVDNGRVEITKPRVVGDSIVGGDASGPYQYRYRDAVDQSEGQAFGVALADVTRVETRHVNVGATVAVILLTGAVVAALAAYLYCSSQHECISGPSLGWY